MTKIAKPFFFFFNLPHLARQSQGQLHIGTLWGLWQIYVAFMVYGLIMRPKIYSWQEYLEAMKTGNNK